MRRKSKFVYSNNYYGIRSTSSDFLDIHTNRVSKNREHGLYFHDSFNNVLNWSIFTFR